MFILGMLLGAIIVVGAWALTIWYKNRKAQIKEKVVETINKV